MIATTRIGVVAHSHRLCTDKHRRSDRDWRARWLWLEDATGAKVLGLDAGEPSEENARSNHIAVWDELTGTECLCERPEPHDMWSDEPRPDWLVVLEDDAQPIDGFKEQLRLALTEAPTPVVSLYLGTGHPTYWQPRIERALAIADRRGAHWLTCRNVIHAVGLAIRTEYVPSMLEELKRTRGPIDESITRWVVKCVGKQQVSYTVPSLVDHMDGLSLIPVHADGKPRRAARKAWRVGARSKWNSESVSLT